MYGHKYSEDEQTFMAEFVPGHSYKEIAAAFTEKFGWEISINQVSSYIGNHHLNTGRTGRFQKGQEPPNKGKKGIYAAGSEKTWFKKGNIPANHRPEGNRYFDHPVSMDICNSFVRLSKDEVTRKVQMKYHRELFFAEHFGRMFSVEVMNIRAETKESRDLLQDLEDIKNGIQIQHASDNIRDEKERKKARRQQAYEKRIQRLEKKILEVGYENLADYSIDKVHADKWLTDERIRELEEMRQQKINEEQEKPVQMSLFDYL